ncbi:8-amino-7-oxononanoate synthase [Sporosarcina sp. 179-K 3D1 HS]|uniref:8-amino-7-oxononanoate synthase n=1 Tax=Sporosarcina sp. 179-K 3D1 HS TaxID=3232169 RepID=UPI0039A27174
MEQRFFETLEQLESTSLLRSMRTFATGNEAEAVIDGQRLLLFSSNNYLGLATDSRLKKKAAAAIEDFGTGAGGARLTTGNSVLHEQLEKEIADWKRTESALVFSSGYLANLGAISSISQKGDVIFSDALNHASLIDGCRLSRAQTIIYKHRDMADLESKLRAHSGTGKKLIVTDGVFSMDGTIAPLPAIVELAERYDAYVLVDDAHGSGVLGSNGEGTASHFGIQDKIDFTVGTMSKAIGAEGGFVAGSASAIIFLQNRARPFIFQTALAPATIAAAREGVRILRTEPDRREALLQNVQKVLFSLKDEGFQLLGSGETPILSVLVGDAARAMSFSHRLLERGIFIPAIRPPTVPLQTSRLRITFMASHTDDHLQQLLNALVDTGKELGIV